MAKTASEIPNKLFYKIGEVCEFTDTQPYVLRFWESEFPQLKPTKSSTGQRMYRRKDVESVLTIKRLLYEEGFTIAGARQHLREEGKPAPDQTALPFSRKASQDGLVAVRQGLKDILGILSTRR